MLRYFFRLTSWDVNIFLQKIGLENFTRLFKRIRSYVDHI